jgi:hypothetical protein
MGGEIMSILLSLYVKDGIVFAADKNLTLSDLKSGQQTVLEGDLTKVLLWPNRKAVIGFVGHAELEDLSMDDWLRLFIAETRDFQHLRDVADLLCEKFQAKVPKSRPRLLVHLGGFELVDGIQTPMLYLITNVIDLAPKETYQGTSSKFNVTENFKPEFEGYENPSKYPDEVRKRFAEMEERDHFQWFNNGTRYAAFNALKGGLFAALSAIRQIDNPNSPYTLSDWIIYAKMAVELHGSYFRNAYVPDKRVVGGGAEVCYIPWPE